MINLIPNEEKKQKVKDFYFRLSVIFFVVLSLSIMTASVAILPAYFLSSVKKNLATTKLEAQKGELVSLLDQEVLTTVGDLESKITLTETSQQNKYILSLHVINEILLKKMSNIKITKITYSDILSKGKNINISGTAPSREQLLLFRKVLEDNVLFKEVNLPVSNFVKGSNIQFSMSLIPS